MLDAEPARVGVSSASNMARTIGSAVERYCSAASWVSGKIAVCTNPLPVRVT